MSSYEATPPTDTVTLDVSGAVDPYPFPRRTMTRRTLGRKGTLVRPERYVNSPLLRTQTMRSTRRMLAGPAGPDASANIFAKSEFDTWTIFSKMMTCCFPAFCLNCCNIKGAGPQQAWREKVTLCWIIVILCAFVVFFIVALNPLLCPTGTGAPVPIDAAGGIIVFGTMYRTNPALGPEFTNPRGSDLSDLFQQPPVAACQQLNATTYPFAFVQSPCQQAGNCRQLAGSGLKPFDRLDGGESVDPLVAYTWDEIEARGYVVVKDSVLNLKPYFDQFGRQPLPNNPVDAVLRRIRNRREATRILNNLPEFAMNREAFDCLVDKYVAGQIAAQDASCIISYLFSIIVAVIVLGVLLSRFVMAVIFDWFISHRLARTPNQFASAAAVGYANRSNDTELTYISDRKKMDIMNPNDIGLDLYTVLLVTCYSEGEASLRTTMESMAATDYTDSRKLLFIIADGLITGKGNPKSTPDLLLDMIEIDQTFGDNPKPYSYIAVASGSKQHNMARVYVGHFSHAGHRVPTILVIKCGTPEEASEAKPGNRGKRDSQLILMNFFTRVLLNDRMTPLDFDLFRKVHHLMGVTPDFFEIVLMVDADTKVAPDSLRLMINAMHNDQLIMGLCGETRIANKTQSWVTMIQVFEYYISHHLGKAFESVFGGVTCLPGCFCMYRIKARKDGEWVPILANPDVVETYSTNEVDTLHQKNLLLLGEDRFLTTLMLRTFTNRKMVFIPRAVCKTVVPDDFATLLSQRRRWINSTIHNLMELVLVNNLCGTFCFSMQFIVLLDLISTAVLPASILTTIYLIINAIVSNVNKDADPGQWLNIGTLLFVIFFPSLIVVLSFRRWQYIMWMGVYILALPIWNFVLPVYAFWHFDDFSWGATRQVTGAGGASEKNGHGNEGGTFDGSKVSLKRWEEYERAWRRNVAKGKQMAEYHPRTPSPSPTESSHADLLAGQTYYAEGRYSPTRPQQLVHQFSNSVSSSEAGSTYHGSYQGYGPVK
ncbi:uncharacterized protein SPPG_05426 [Spizellomyces punctatus DAOM BR117]|uniref:chitin synthase n=1 Tax=Spizellomyces punctatus (strain DAOM BR117) TaxID=645134 RepID=A0A0L0HDG5_SPIPD|nr:uncharacterized protein SPPG_05426 [Spizellomyces punctatus DAOM BR117]KNC99172.1 hypothetical protein SPPG_05426 [Spizellomyces punctatus DAOM BR117]|eukprot:XP_016607212.1 hypothetical protein SPPG_05426 [Spizellomyces punctatus DAOM BR117]